MINKEIRIRQINVRGGTYKKLDDSRVNEFNESVMASYNSELARDSVGKLGSFYGQATGSNPFKLAHLHSSGLLGVFELAIKEEVEAVEDEMDLWKCYVEPGFAVKTGRDSNENNDLIAQVLAEDLKSRGISLGSGVLIPYSNLRNEERIGVPYGIVLRLNDLATKESVRDLSSYWWPDSQRGGEGVSSVCLDSEGFWRSSWGSKILSDSNDSGRIVVVETEKK